MDVIGFLGERLAELTEKPTPVAMGFVRLAIRDSIGSDYDLINYDSLRKVLETSLRARLTRIRMPDVDGIIDGMLRELVDIQSMIIFSV